MICPCGKRSTVGLSNMHLKVKFPIPVWTSGLEAQRTLFLLVSARYWSTSCSLNHLPCTLISRLYVYFGLVMASCVAPSSINDVFPLVILPTPQPPTVTCHGWFGSEAPTGCDVWSIYCGIYPGKEMIYLNARRLLLTGTPFDTFSSGGPLTVRKFIGTEISFRSLSGEIPAGKGKRTSMKRLLLIPGNP